MFPYITTDQALHQPPHSCRQSSSSVSSTPPVESGEASSPATTSATSPTMPAEPSAASIVASQIKPPTCSPAKTEPASPIKPSKPLTSPLASPQHLEPEGQLRAPRLSPPDGLAGLRSPLLLLGQAGRSRSEEPASVSPPQLRPRHRSESLASSPVNSPAPQLPTPPEAFRDPPTRAPSTATNSRLRQQQFAEARSSSVLSAPTLKEEADEPCHVSDSTAADRKMSRSNTISFGAKETAGESSEQQVAEKLAELRLRRTTVTGEEVGTVGDSQMEHKALPSRQPVALVPGKAGRGWSPVSSLPRVLLL